MMSTFSVLLQTGLNTVYIDLLMMSTSSALLQTGLNTVYIDLPMMSTFCVLLQTGLNTVYIDLPMMSTFSVLLQTGLNTVYIDLSMMSTSSVLLQTGLNHACGNGFLPILELLATLEDIDVNQPDRDGNTPLIFAAQAGQILWGLPWEKGSWGQHGAHLGPTGPRWAPCWLHELCFLGILCLGMLLRYRLNRIGIPITYDKTVSRPSNLHNDNPVPEKTAFMFKQSPNLQVNCNDLVESCRIFLLVSNYTNFKVCDEIIYPFQTSMAAVKFEELISNFIPHFTGHTWTPVIKRGHSWVPVFGIGT